MIGQKLPINSTTNRSFSMNGESYLAYDVDTSLYTNKYNLGGYDHVHFSIRSFHTDGRLFYW